MERFRRNSIGDSFFSFGCDASVTDAMLISVLALHSFGGGALFLCTIFERPDELTQDLTFIIICAILSPDRSTTKQIPYQEREENRICSSFISADFPDYRDRIADCDVVAVFE